MNNKKRREAAIAHLIFTAIILSISSICFGLASEVIIMAAYGLNWSVAIAFLVISLFALITFALGYLSADCAWPWVCDQLEEMCD